MTKKVTEDTISKALESLQELAKGHSSRGTATTAVDSMRDAGAGAGSDAGSTQVYHTPSNSDRKGWAGSTATSVPEDGATDGIAEDGTDYAGASGLMKSILDKLAKGQELSPSEQYVLKSELSKAKKDDDEDVDKAGGSIVGPSDYKSVSKASSDDDDKDRMEDDDAKKSLSDYASDNEEVSKGLEMSPFLAGWAEVQHEAAQTMEERIVQRLTKSLRDVDESNSSYQAEMAKSVAALAEVLTAQAQRIEQLETAPARGPKSVQAQPVEKSFGAGGAPSAQQGGEQLSKAIVLDTMINMVEKGKLPAQEVVKFESSNELRPDIYEAVVAHRSGR